MPSRRATSSPCVSPSSPRRSAAPREPVTATLHSRAACVVSSGLDFRTGFAYKGDSGSFFLAWLLLPPQRPPPHRPTTPQPPAPQQQRPLTPRRCVRASVVLEARRLLSVQNGVPSGTDKL